MISNKDFEIFSTVKGYYDYLGGIPLFGTSYLNCIKFDSTQSYRHFTVISKHVHNSQLYRELLCP